MKEDWKDIYFISNGVTYDYRGLYQVSDMRKSEIIRKDKPIWKTY